MRHDFTFDDATHTYRIDKRVVPGVTSIIHEFIPTFKAHQWYLNRGKAVHKCAEYIANGIEFEHDPQIDGQVLALRKLFADIRPKVYMTETPVCSHLYQYAGTLDLLAHIDNRRMIVDYKGTVVPELVGLQCGAYAQCDQIATPEVKYAIGIQIKSDGTYKITEPIDLKQYKREFLCLRTAYAIKQRMGLIEKENVA